MPEPSGVAGREEIHRLATVPVGGGIGEEMGPSLQAWEAVLNEILELRHTGLLDTTADAYKVPLHTPRAL